MRNITLKYILLILVFCSMLSAALAEAPSPTIPLSDCDTSFLSKEPGLNWENDPFLKKPGFAVRDQDPDDLKLEAVIWDQTSPRAIINGVGVRKGDRVQKKRVTKIGENYVVLEEEDSLVELTIPLRNSGKTESMISIEEVSK